jgi:hypothetical protein
MTILSLMGRLDPESILWQPISIEAQPDRDDIRDYNRFKNLTPTRDFLQKYFCDLRRVCEVEETVVEWFQEAYVQTNSLKKHIVRKVKLAEFQEQFEILNAEVGGIDFSVWKVLMKVKKCRESSYRFYKELNMGITVRA